VPDFPSAATETWGLIVYDEGRFLFKENYNTLKDKQEMTGTVAHEFVHMVFLNNYASLDTFIKAYFMKELRFKSFLWQSCYKYIL
jgi:hypothetical protein